MRSFRGTKARVRFDELSGLSKVRPSWGQTLVGLHEFPDPSDTLPFDERRIGLDHLAFACSGRDELEAWEIRLSELGIDNGGIVDAGYGAALSCRDPDNIALEFFTPAL